MTSRRVERTKDQVRDEISNLLLFKTKDPRLQKVSVTRVEMSADLKRARVKYSVYDSSVDRGVIQTLLEKASGFFRREIGGALRMKYVPEIIFEFDQSLEYSQHMSTVIDGLDIKAEDEQESD